MGRYTGPYTKVSRRFGEPIYGPDKTLDKRPTPPGQHGGRRKRKNLSEYGEQLREKQKARFTYGMREAQFRTFFERAKARQGVTGDILIQLCETRLDNIVYRMGLAATRPAARQLVSHRHVTIDDKVCNIPSAIVKPGQKIGLREKSRGLMAVADPTTGELEPYVIEYNVRMGDPETESVFPRIKSDMVGLLEHVWRGNLQQTSLEIDPRAAACVMAVAEGYPGHYEKGQPINGIDDVDGSIVYHAGTRLDDQGRLLTNGGRVLCVTSLADSIPQALLKSYQELSKISWNGMYYRRDIGQDLLKMIVGH